MSGDLTPLLILVPKYNIALIVMGVALTQLLLLEMIMSYKRSNNQSEYYFTDKLDVVYGAIAFILFLLYPAVFMYL